MHLYCQCKPPTQTSPHTHVSFVADSSSRLSFHLLQPHSETEGARYLLTEREEEQEALRNSPPPPVLKPQPDGHQVKGVKGTLIGRAVGRAMFHGAGDGQAIKRRVHLCHIAQQQQRGIIGEPQRWLSRPGLSSTAA